MRQLNKRNLKTYLNSHTWFLNNYNLKGQGIDIGCGEGFFIKYFNENFPVQLNTGIDISKKLCYLAKKVNPKVEIINSQAEKINLNDNLFDLVFINSVLHHVEDVKKTIDEAMRIAKNKARIIIIEPRRTHPLIISHSLIKKHERGQLKLNLNKVKRYLKLKGALKIKEFPVNSFVYPYQRFPPSFLFKIFSKIEDLFKLPYISTHQAIIAEIRK